MQEQPEDVEVGTRLAARSRARQLAVDFMRVEDAGTMPAMGPLELAVRKKIAERSRTPLGGLIQEEEKTERTAALRSGKRTLRLLIRRGALTPRQRLIYQLCYEKRLREGEVARTLGIARATVQRLRQKVRGAFIRALARRRREKLIWRSGAFHRLTRRQKRVFRLRFYDGENVKTIATRLGRTERSVQRLLRRALEKIFPG